MKHLRHGAELALAIAAVALVGACAKGPGEPPRTVPSWSPPSWLHGTWMGRNDPRAHDTPAGPNRIVAATVRASAYNLVIDVELVGEVQHTFDLEQLGAAGDASIMHHAGSAEEGHRYYSVVLISAERAQGAEDPGDSFICSEVDSTTIDCIWSKLSADPDGEEMPVGALRLTKQ